MEKKLPPKWQGYLWSKSLGEIDLQKDRVYIIHNILRYGELEDIKILYRIYPETEIKKIFIKYPRRIYTPASFNFIKNFVLGLNSQYIDEEKYLEKIS